MDLRDKVFGSTVAAICQTTVLENNLMAIGSVSAGSAGIDGGDEIRVRLLNADGDSVLRARDSAAFTTTTLPPAVSQQMLPDEMNPDSPVITIPSNIIQKLDLSVGDAILYIAVPTDKVPTANSGPARKAAGSAAKDVQSRPRDVNQVSRSGAPIATTGQITITSQMRSDLNIGQGDTISVEVTGPNGTAEGDYTIKSGNRITLPSEDQDKIGIPKGESGDVDILVRIP